MGGNTEPLTSVLVAWRSADPVRIRLWNHCWPLWEQLPVQLCVSDDGNATGPFARAAAWNRAAKSAAGDVFVVWGADMLPDLAAIQDAASVAQEHGWARVFSRIISYTAGQTDAILAGADPLSIVAHNAPYDVPGVLAVRRDVWDAVGGMDERFGVGYGYEDCALRNLLAHRYGAHRARAQHAVRCLYHSHTQEPAPANSRLFREEYRDLAPGLN